MNSACSMARRVKLTQKYNQLSFRDRLVSSARAAQAAAGPAEQREKKQGSVCV